MKHIISVDDRFLSLEVKIKCADAQHVQEVLTAFDEFLKGIKETKPDTPQGAQFNKYGRPNFYLK